MQFSERMAHIKPSATLTINAKALELKSQGVDVTSLAIGEPNFPTPAHVCDAAKQAIDEGFTRYTAVPGIPPLREAIAGYFKRAYGVDVAPDCTIASNGGKQSLYNLFAALLNDGDEVLIPSPYWVSYPDMVYLNGGVPVAVKAPASQGFKVTVEQLEAALTPKAKILVFNSPSNPTGACYSVSERDAIVKWALDRGLFIIADEIYDQLVYEPNKPSSIIVWWKQYPDRIAVVNGLAKSFAMTGWRVGYTVTHPDLVKKLSQITGQATGNICSVSQKAAVAALTGPYDCVESMRQAFQKRRDMAWKEIASWSNGRGAGSRRRLRSAGLYPVLLRRGRRRAHGRPRPRPQGPHRTIMLTSGSGASRNRKTPPADGTFQETVCILWIGSTHGPDGC